MTKVTSGHLAAAIWLATNAATSSGNPILPRSTDLVVGNTTAAAASNPHVAHPDASLTKDRARVGLKLATNGDLSLKDKVDIARYVTGGRKISDKSFEKLVKIYHEATPEEKAMRERLYGSVCGSGCGENCTLKKRSDSDPDSDDDGEEHLQKRCE